jgi:predicted phosphodiesterase
MRVAALYDIHGNLPALEAVLADALAAGVETLVVGGDVLPGPMPRECLALLRNLGIPAFFILGNGDRSVLEARAGDGLASIPEAFREVIRWNAEQLTSEEARWVSSWPRTFQLEVDRLGPVLFCHATPRDDTEIFTRRTSDEVLVPVFEEVGAPVVVCGHTHMQFDRLVGATRVVNAGSVGMPFGESGAYWLLLGDGIELRRTPYDVDVGAERIRATQYPGAEAFAAGSVLHPPTQEEMLDALGRSELKD